MLSLQQQSLLHSRIYPKVTFHLRCSTMGCKARLSSERYEELFEQFENSEWSFFNTGYSSSPYCDKCSSDLYVNNGLFIVAVQDKMKTSPYLLCESCDQTYILDELSTENAEGSFGGAFIEGWRIRDDKVLCAGCSFDPSTDR